MKNSAHFEKLERITREILNPVENVAHRIIKDVEGFADYRIDGEYIDAVKLIGKMKELRELLGFKEDDVKEGTFVKNGKLEFGD